MEVISAATTNQVIYVPSWQRYQHLFTSFISNVLKTFILCGILTVGRYMHHTHAWWLRRPERSIRSPRTMSQHVGAGIEPGSSARAASAVIGWAISLALTTQIIVHPIAYEEYWNNTNFFQPLYFCQKKSILQLKLYGSFRTKPSLPQQALRTSYSTPSTSRQSHAVAQAGLKLQNLPGLSALASRVFSWFFEFNVIFSHCVGEETVDMQTS